jgi:hypothetical protein
MPIHKGRDAMGMFYQWGAHGKKYYYTASSKTSELRAKAQAKAQARAIYASGYSG